MSLNIKLEKLVNENVDNNMYKVDDYISLNEYNKLSSENQNLEILVSHNKIKFDEQNATINQLTMQINDMSKSIKKFEHQMKLLKNTNNAITNIISEKNKHLNIIYEAIDNLELDKKRIAKISDPKCAIMKINQYQQDTKQWRSKVADNKIIIMTICKILCCDNSKILQSIKDVINESEKLKRRCRTFEQFYQKSVELTNSMASELHRNGYEQTSSAAENTFCKIHSESFEHWNKKISNTRYEYLNNKTRRIAQTPSFISFKTDTQLIPLKRGYSDSPGSSCQSVIQPILTSPFNNNYQEISHYNTNSRFISTPSRFMVPQANFSNSMKARALLTPVRSMICNYPYISNVRNNQHLKYISSVALGIRDPAPLADTDYKEEWPNTADDGDASMVKRPRI